MGTSCADRPAAAQSLAENQRLGSRRSQRLCYPPPPPPPPCHWGDCASIACHHHCCEIFTNVRILFVFVLPLRKQLQWRVARERAAFQHVADHLAHRQSVAVLHAQGRPHSRPDPPIRQRSREGKLPHAFWSIRLCFLHPPVDGSVFSLLMTFFFTSFNRLSLIDWRRRFICSTPSRLPGGREKKCCFFSFTPPPSYPFPSSDASLNYSSFPKMRVSTVCVCVCVCVSARESGSVRVGGRATWIGFYWEQVGVISRLDRCLIFTEFFFPLFCGCSTCCIKLNRGTCCVFFCFAVRYRKLQGVVFDQVQCNFLLWHFYFRAWFYNCRKFLSDAPSRIPLPPIHWIEWHSFADYFSFMDILFVRASPIEQYTFILLLWFLFIPFHFILPSSLTVMLHHPISWSIHHEPHSDWVVWVLFVQLIELNGAFLNSNHGFPPVGRLMTFDIRRENYHVLNDGRFFFNGFLKNFLAIPFQQLNRCSLKAQRLFNARMKSFCWEFLRTEWMNTSLANREIPFEIFRNNRKAFNFKLSPLKWQQDDER